MGPNGGRLATIGPAPVMMNGTKELPKSLTFHDFCELTQRELAELSVADNKGAVGQPLIWRPRHGGDGDCIREDDEEEEEEAEVLPEASKGSWAAGPSPASTALKTAPRWQTISRDDRDIGLETVEKQSKRMAKSSKGAAIGGGQPQQRKRTLSAAGTFSSWLQLFLAKRRHRHNSRYLDVNSRLMHQSCYDGLAGANGGPLRSSVSLSVVHEGTTLGSDGESMEVSPCTSDQSATGGSGGALSLTAEYTTTAEYVPKVKLRQKQNRRWTEEDIQKRLSLPPDIKLPPNVIDKLNRTPTLENPLTRKSKRASLSEIGFGKLETYKKIFDLGEGTYATVYLGKSLLTGKNVALKEIRLEHEEGAPCTAIREVSLLRNLKHANIVTLHDIVYTDRVLTLVFEFVERDLREYMEELDGMISIANVKLFLVQLLRGLAYCHSRRILHRDLKPQNLLINRAGELKLADFGLARAQSVPTKTYSNEVVTLWYRPPDVLLGSTDYSTHIDMWGVGCILFEMFVHKPMFPGSTSDEQLNLIFQRLGTPTPETHAELCALPNFKGSHFRAHSPKALINSPRITPERADLLYKLLKYEGRQRITAPEAMRHPFLQCFPEQIFKLADSESVLSLPGVQYARDTRNELHTRGSGRQS